MQKILLFLLFLLPVKLLAQMVPLEGSELHYRIVGFSFPLAEKATTFKIEIATGSHYEDAPFAKNIIKTATANKSKVIAEVPYFATAYTWRATYTLPGNPTPVKSPFFHFKTGFIPEIDTTYMRVRVINPATKHKDNYVFIDGNRILCDMNGKPVWYHPTREAEANGKSGVRDLRLTPQNTITYLQDEHGFEINYVWDTIWQTPRNGKVSGDTAEHFHHELVRLSNGHYMVLGSEYIKWKEHITTAPPETNPAAGAPFDKTNFGTLIEYDEKGNVVWSWKSSSYFLNSDVIYYQPDQRSKVVDVHENAFFFDERDSIVYISFKNISRILKIKYPEGTVLNVYGETFRQGVEPQGNGLFCDQHACRHSEKGYLYLYNNNICNDSTEYPKVILMQEPVTGNTLKKIWEYECNVDGININPAIRKAKEKQAQMQRDHLKPPMPKGTLLRGTSGGNVIEMPDNSLFICMNTQYSKLLIVNKEKKILWSAVPEKYNANKKDWFIMPQQYRASIISRKDLEALIMNSMPKGGKRQQHVPPQMPK
jgi:hypothetical protein